MDPYIETHKHIYILHIYEYIYWYLFYDKSRSAE